jgi:hypothetical protein
MIPNHPRFLEAIHEKKKVSVRFYSKADSGVVDRICAPLDYGPGDGFEAGPNRYWLWDCAPAAGLPTLGLVPEQILDLQVLGQEFDPAQFGAPPLHWSIPREWGSTPTETSSSSAEGNTVGEDEDACP